MPVEQLILLCCLNCARLSMVRMHLPTSMCSQNRPMDHPARPLPNWPVTPLRWLFLAWHSFAVTRAMENQVYLLSLNRAGADYGGSVFCPPWLDDDHPPQFFRLTSKPLSAWSLILIY